jgi:hypothetical protein
VQSGIQLCHLLPTCGDAPPVKGGSSQLSCQGMGGQQSQGVGIQ